MKRFFYPIALLFLIASLLTGCQKTSQENTEDSLQTTPTPLDSDRDESEKTPQTSDIPDTSENESDSNIQRTPEECFSDTLFIGDSRVEGLFLYTTISDYAEFYSRVGLNINDALEDPFVTLDHQKVTILDALRTQKFNKIYIMLGFNELGWPNDYIFIERYQNFLEEISSLQPDATIYLQSLIHVTEEHSKQDAYENNPRIDQYNKNIQALANEKNIFYIDLNPCFDDKSHALKKDSTTDGIHLKPNYCEIWMEYLMSCS